MGGAGRGRGVGSEVEEDVRLFDAGAVQMRSFSSCRTATSVRACVCACVCACACKRARANCVFVAKCTHKSVSSS